MANEVLKFLNGQATNLANKTVKAGQVYFAINSDGETGSIYFDAPISSSVTKRIAMSGQQVQHAVEADYATHDDLGNVIKETYISQLRLDSAGTKIQYKYPGTQTWSELQPLFLPLAGGQITNDLGVNGTITAGNLIVNGAARFVQTILGNIQTADKWSTARNFSISDATAAHTGTAVSVDGSAAVTIPLPATITATLKGNADTATTATNANNLQAYNSNEVTIGANSTTAGSSTNSAVYINHKDRSNGSTSNGSTQITDYYFENRKGATTGVTIHAATFAGNASSADIWSTGRKFSISDNDATNTGTQVTVNGGADYVLPLPSTIKASLTGNATTATKASKLAVGTAITTAANLDAFLEASVLKATTISTGVTYANGTLTANDGEVISIGFSSTTYGNQIFFDPDTDKISVRRKSTDWKPWVDLIHTGNISSYTAGAAGKWSTKRKFSISDSDASHTGTQVEVDGSADYVLPLPSTIKASLQGNADSATKATKDSNDKTITDEYLHRAANSASTLNQFSGAPSYILGIEAFASGGEVKWQSASSVTVGKATTADTWTTARNFAISDDSGSNTGTSVSVNGNGNVTLPLPTQIYVTGNHMGFINGGETDKFFDFAYGANPTASTAPGASWRIGALNSGSSDTNYFVIQTGGSSTGATTWNNALRIGMNTLDIHVGGNLNPFTNNIKTLGTSSLKWANVYATTFTGDLSGNAATATKWKDARNFSVSDATAAHTGTAQSVNGTGNVVLPLPSTITATLDGNASTATNADKVDNWHMRYYGYKNTYTYTQPTANTVWYLRIKTANWNSDLERIEITATGDNRTGQIVLFTGSRHSNWWGYASNYNFVGILGVYKNIDNADNIWLKIDSTCTKIYLYTTFEATITTESTTDSNYTAPPAGGGIFGNTATFTSFVGNADTTTKWKTARNFSVSDATAAHTGTAVSVDGSNAVTLPLPSTITATIVGNASSATKAYVTIADTTKFYLIGSTNTSSGNADLKEDTGLYAGTTKGQLGAAYVGINGDNTSYRLYVNGTSLMTGVVNINTSTGTLKIGSQNSSWTHFEAQRDFYFSRQASINGNFLPYTDLTYNLGSESYRWLNVYANVLRLQGASSDPSTSAGARIEFTYDNGTSRSQPVYISYTPNDSYRAPAGLKIMGNGGDSSSAWLEVEGAIHSNGIVYAKATTDSSSTSTGAVVVTGGVGIAKQLRVGGNTSLGGTLGVSGATTLASTLTVSGNTSLNGNLTVASNKTTTLGGTLSVSGVATFSNQIKVEKNTDSTKSTDGNASIVTDGGVSVAKQLSAKMIKIDNGQSSKGCQLIYNETNDCLEFVFS